LKIGETIDEQTGTPQPPKKNTWETIIENEPAVSKLIDKLNQTIDNVANKFFQHEEQKSKFSMKMTRMLVFVMSFIVIVAGILTYLNKIDGSTFTFLLGLIVGYALTYFTGALYPPE
jgi:hypothetical protein